MGKKLRTIAFLTALSLCFGQGIWIANAQTGAIDSGTAQDEATVDDTQSQRIDNFTYGGMSAKSQGGSGGGFHKDGFSTTVDAPTADTAIAEDESDEFIVDRAPTTSEKPDTSSETETESGEQDAPAGGLSQDNLLLELKTPDETQKKAEQLIKSDEVTVDIYIEHVSTFVPKYMVFGVYTADKVFWGVQKILVIDTAKTHRMTFEMNEYTLGETVYFSLFSGAECIQYEGETYAVEELIPLRTHTYLSEETNEPVIGNHFALTAIPLSSRKVIAYVNDWELYFNNPAKLYDGVCMIPLDEYLTALSMEERYTVNEASGRVEIKANGHEVVFYLHGHDMYADGEVTYLDVTPQRMNDAIYVPFRFLAEGLGGTVTTEEVDGVLCVFSEIPLPKQTDAESFIHSKGISSRTNYLIWVSKSKFTVTIFLRENGLWKEINAFACSIGAPGTPTITGEFEYFSKEARWSYPTYYVAPIMRFYKGYALHSTLLRYDGSAADARLGKQISHGCVRIAPQNIKWMADTIPLYTKVYITQ